MIIKQSIKQLVISGNKVNLDFKFRISPESIGEIDDLIQMLKDAEPKLIELKEEISRELLLAAPVTGTPSIS